MTVRNNKSSACVYVCVCVSACVCVCVCVCEREHAEHEAKDSSSFSQGCWVTMPTVHPDSAESTEEENHSRCTKKTSPNENQVKDWSSNTYSSITKSQIRLSRCPVCNSRPHLLQLLYGAQQALGNFLK